MKKSKVHLALYGNVGMVRGYCGACEGTALIVEGCFLCCGRVSESEPTKARRISAPEYRRKKPPVAEQERILAEQANCCFWCERQFESHAHRYGQLVEIKCCWDHVSPYIWSADNDPDNFVASCQWCNGWKAALLFRTIEEVKVYVATKWEDAAKSNRKVREVQPAYGAKEAVAEVLFDEV